MIQKISDNLIFNTLKFIKHGQLKVTNFDGEVLKFGNINEKLKV